MDISGHWWTLLDISSNQQSVVDISGCQQMILAVNLNYCPLNLIIYARVVYLCCRKSIIQYIMTPSVPSIRCANTGTAAFQLRACFNLLFFNYDSVSQDVYGT